MQVGDISYLKVINYIRLIIKMEWAMKGIRISNNPKRAYYNYCK